MPQTSQSSSDSLEGDTIVRGTWGDYIVFILRSCSTTDGYRDAEKYLLVWSGNLIRKLVTDDVLSTKKKKGACLRISVRLKDTKNMPAASTRGKLWTRLAVARSVTMGFWEMNSPFDRDTDEMQSCKWWPVYFINVTILMFTLSFS